MIYEAMKWLIDWLVSTYKCECGSSIKDSDVDIVWAAWNTLNLDVMCPKCGRHWMIKSQLVMMDLNWLSQFKHEIEWVSNQLKKDKSQLISDNTIVNLWKDLKNKDIKASDLFE